MKMPWIFLLAIAAGVIVGRVLDRYEGGNPEAEASEEGGAAKASEEGGAAKASEEGGAAETVRAKVAEVAEVAERGGAEGTAATPETPGESRTGKIDVRQEGILNVLSDLPGSSVAMSLAEIARRMGMPNHAPLIRPMRSLCDEGQVVKVNKAYRLSTMPH